ncbi:MAG: 16S rRNA (guanine(966)-N(2))-methyltransferase RsmD [Bacteroidia bacterium]|nr:16S rRNA (guanine(966)-N(2))-methyltransferase RsmD [Bacteroidia bacterium]MDW8302594.1 16S rRNA (guanine(966)-N(2))-methyltransferase RsmD [Bacteroidia bacterium]
MIRIIAGKFKGKRLYPPKNLCTKPTMDIAKEGLFNILQHKFDWSEVRWLELFAGTGNMTYEAISRGALSATMVEKDKKCISFIQKQIQDLNISSQITLIPSDVWDFIAQPCLFPYTIVFLDPPYQMANTDKIVSKIFENHLVLPEGIVILEHESTKSFEGLSFFRQKRVYGRSAFSFFSNEYSL